MAVNKTMEAIGSALTAKPPDQLEVINCIDDHVVILSERGSLQLSPLGVTPIDEQMITEFALNDLSGQQVVKIHTKDNPQPTSATSSVGLIPIAAVLYFVGRANIHDEPIKTVFAWGVPILSLLTIAMGLFVLKRRQNDLVQILSLVAVVALGAGIPIGSAFWFGHLLDLIRRGAPAELFARSVQTLFIAIAATVPTLLFFLFDRHRVLTLRRTFQRRILRLDPTLGNLYDVEAAYGDQVTEALGRESTRATRINPANRFPIFLAAALIALGWVMSLPVAVESPAGKTDLVTLLTPRHTTFVFGFLGAYFFAINVVARRFVRGDLRPKAYGAITVRILTVFAFSFVLDVAFPAADWVLVAAFVVGIIPETFFTLISEIQRGVLGQKVKVLYEPHPLTKLEGIDIYDRARLEDEGVNNVEALAHHDLVDLMLGTRIPVARLVDWVDQAILYLHTVTPEGVDSLPRQQLFRSFGIRTASDLLTVNAKPDLWAALTTADATLGPAGQLDSLVVTLSDDEWMRHVLEWRRTNDPGKRVFHVQGARAVPVPAT